MTTRIRRGIVYLTLAGALMLGSGWTACQKNCNPPHLEQRIERVEQRQPQDGRENYAVVLIDMQDSFLSAIDKKEKKNEIPNQIEILEYAQRNDLPIYVLEYRDHGRTTRKLRWTLLNSDYETITKRGDNGFEDTNLDELLQQREIDNLILMGINASFCVKYTAEGALDNGYGIITSPDLIADPGSWENNESAGWYEKKGILFKNHSELIDYLESPEK